MTYTFLNLFVLPTILREGEAEGGSGAGAGDKGGEGSGSFFKPGAGEGAGEGTGEGSGAGEGAGEGNPAWLKDKYAVKGEDGALDVMASSQKQAEAYNELFSSYSKKTDTLKAEVATEYATNYAKERGVPDDVSGYEYPDTVEAPGEEIDTTLRAWAKDNNVGGEAFQQLINDVWAKTFPDPAAEAALLGKTEADVNARVEKINTWINGNIDGEHHGAIESLMTTASGVMFMESIADKMSPSGFAPTEGTQSTTTPLTRAAIREMQADPKFGDDEAYTAKVREKWQQYTALPPEKQV